LELAEMLRFIEADFLIIEGMKDAPVPKLVCAETTAQLDELIDDTCIGVSGLIADTIPSYRSLKVYCLQKELNELVDHVLDRVFDVLPMADPECCSACGASCGQMAADIVQGRKIRQDCLLDAGRDVILQADGQEIVIVPFVQQLLRDTLRALTKNLKGVNPEAELTLTIKP
ncbi:MAG TPA: molybdopterin-guanine dinucleotide biosynthesis protein MobB, partial [Candidatus Cloacimonadota bacterium]|nr:molybdopterin-guanine dinucleotide biosynthesis protein MobB [Candidatus Cloacimonadota bacterium]